MDDSVRQLKKKPFQKMTVSELTKRLSGTRKLLEDRSIIAALPDDGAKLRENISVMEALLKEKSQFLVEVTKPVQYSSDVVERSVLKESPGMTLRHAAAQYRTKLPGVVGQESARETDDDQPMPEISDLERALEDISVRGSADESLLPSERIQSDGNNRNISEIDVQQQRNKPLSSVTDAKSDGERLASSSKQMPNSRFPTGNKVSSSAVPRRLPTTAKPPRVQILSMEEAHALVERDRQMRQEHMQKAKERLEQTQVAPRPDPALIRMQERRAAQFLSYRDEEDELTNSESSQSEPSDDEDDDLVEEKEDDEAN